MDRLGEDLVLLAVGDGGRLAQAPRLPQALLGAELARLAAAGRVRVVRHLVVVCSELPLGDREMDATLARLAAQQPPHISEVMRHPPRGMRTAYLARLAGQGVVRRQSRLIGRDRWNIIDVTRRADVCARIEAIMTTDEPISVDDATLAALVYAAGLDAVVYPGLPGWQRRQRMEHLARREWPVFTAEDAPVAVRWPRAVNTSADGTMQGIDSRVGHEVTRAAIDAVVRDSVRSVMHAALHAVAAAEHHGHSEHGGISHGGGGHSEHGGISHGGGGGGHHGH